MTDRIIVRGAREHNLKNITIELPRDQLIVMTGLSGSGKSSLAFDTIYAEGQRRYVESLSAYARQFLGDMTKPDVDHIEGLSPAISIDQKSTTRNPRSTVATQTEIYDYLRVLFARVGHPHCPECGREIERQSSQQIIERVSELPESTRFMVLAPVVRGRKGEYRDVFERLRREGFARVRVDGNLRNLEEDIVLDKKLKHTIEVVVDRLVMKEGLGRRLADSIEAALRLGTGTVVIATQTEGEGAGGSSAKSVSETKARKSASATGATAAAATFGDTVYSEHFACPDHDIAFPELEPRIFSFNTPYGACPACTGLGTKMEIDPTKVIPDPTDSLEEGAVAPWWGGAFTGYYMMMLRRVAESFDERMDTPWEELPVEMRNVILRGSDGEKLIRGRRSSRRVAFEGVLTQTLRRYQETESENVRAKIEEYMTNKPCPVCKGARLRVESLSVIVGGMNISQVTALSARDALAYIDGLALSEKEMDIARRVLREVRERVGFMVDVGLDYLTLDRASGTLSGGESQRIRLATQIGASLMGVLYVLDEPSIGLHSRDNTRLIQTLERLRDLGNTLIVVEHDEETIRRADYVVDIGPGAGEFGGEVVAAGSVSDVEGAERSVTGAFLSGRRAIQVPAARRKPRNETLTVVGATQHNLKDITVDIPLGIFTCITGVSGSGKSTLIRDILYPALARRLYRSKMDPGAHKELKGWEYIDKVIDIDQSPIGRTPRSNPATYTGVFDEVRKVFSQVPESRLRGYKPGRFSFNVRGGRCESCRGDGTIKIEMHFLPDVYVPCEVCKGARYNAETLEVSYKGKSIAQVLALSVEEAAEFFAPIPNIKRKLDVICDVGLGYVRLGQPATTLSGGEAQRVKLATELSKRATGRTLYMLDEPTTGLHFADIEKLLTVLGRLVDAGNSILVIEHNLDVIKSADWLIDLGPEGGDGGGEVIAVGTPEKIAATKRSYTGGYLAEHMGVRKS